jgi:hypothetical protein
MQGTSFFQISSLLLCVVKSLIYSSMEIHVSNKEKRKAYTVLIRKHLGKKTVARHNLSLYLSIYLSIHLSMALQFFCWILAAFSVS